MTESDRAWSCFAFCPHCLTLYLNVQGDQLRCCCRSRNTKRVRTSEDFNRCPSYEDIISGRSTEEENRRRREEDAAQGNGPALIEAILARKVVKL